MSKDKDIKDMMMVIICILIISVTLIIIGSLCFKSAGFQRGFKSFQSEYGGGMNRTVTLYDYNGNEIKRWTGKFDVESNDSKVLFDNNGKRVIIYNGIVVNEEE